MDLSYLDPVKNGVAPNRDRIAEMFKGKNVFITGGTGFLGKMLIEKILRCCPEVGTIYMHARVKKGKSPKQRIEEIFNAPLFETLRKTRPSAIKQMVAINGDIELADLGISKQDRALLIEKVHIVYHSAATTRFDDPIKRAVLINTRGTRAMLELAQQFKHLLGFVHVSTAYCHLQEALLHEKVYDPPADPHKIIQTVELMDDAVLKNMEKELMGDVANTYVFTKALAESLVAEKMDTMPVIITRPSIVLPIWQEPLPGWTDNINGPTGLLIGAGKGVIRTMMCKEQGYADFFPADIACNAFLVATWNFIANKDMTRRVYNVTSSTEFKVSWYEIIEMGRELIHKVPLNGIAWYPGGSMKSSRLAHNLALIFTHWIPAYFLDAILFICGQKPFMVRVQDRIIKGMVVFEYFANHQWDFVNANLRGLREYQTEKEKKVYCLRGDNMNIMNYFETCIHAARIYLLKEMPETLPAARRHLKMMYWVDKIFKVLFWYLMFYLITSYSQTAKNTSDMIFDYAKSFIPPAIMGTSDVTSHGEL